jgi:hypothetical protein
MTNPLPNPKSPTTNRSTGPRTAAGKQRSSMNALRHGLTAASAVLPSEDQAAYDNHRRGFFNEYQPATPTETQLTQELADTAWRLNRIPSLEADLLSQNPSPQTLIPQLATLGLHYARLSRQFQKAVDKLREIQAERREAQERDLKRAAGLLELHKHKGIPYDLAQDGFVFSNQQIEDFAQRRMRLNESRETEYRICHIFTPAQAVAAREKSAAAREKSAAGVCEKSAAGAA